MSTLESFGRPVTRHGERPVRLTHHDGSILHGIEYREHHGNVPALVEVESINHAAYRAWWSGRGWAITGETR